MDAETRYKISEYIKEWEASNSKNKVLKLSMLSLTEIPWDLIPKNIKRLDVSINKLTDINYLPETLDYFNAGLNEITNVCALPHGLKTLILDKNNIEFLPELPLRLVSLFVSDNNISVLPYLPRKLKELDITNNRISMLPNLPPKLTTFVCLGNLLPPEFYEYENPMELYTLQYYHKLKIKNIRVLYFNNTSRR